MTEKQQKIVSKYAGRCHLCHGDIPVGAEIWWEPGGYGATHIECQSKEDARPWDRIRKLAVAMREFGAAYDRYHPVRHECEAAQVSLDSNERHLVGLTENGQKVDDHTIQSIQRDRDRLAVAQPEADRLQPEYDRLKAELQALLAEYKLDPKDEDAARRIAWEKEV
jgi:hypothetical protein